MPNYADVVKRSRCADIAKRKACSPPEYAPSKKMMKQAGVDGDGLVALRLECGDHEPKAVIISWTKMDFHVTFLIN